MSAKGFLPVAPHTTSGAQSSVNSSQLSEIPAVDRSAAGVPSRAASPGDLLPKLPGRVVKARVPAFFWGEA